MKFKTLLLIIITVAVVGCKSKKRATQTTSTQNNTVKVEENKQITKAVPKQTYTKLTTLQYIDVYSEIAMDEMRKYKIPASITLAQGILESSSGNSELTRRSNNHFGIKCHKGWKGHKTYHDDDEKGECFRVYDDPVYSFNDHSEFLTTRSRYAKLFTYKPYDYVKWAKGLSSAGYATDRRYPAKLIALIEKYQLYKYDEIVLGKKYNKPKIEVSEIHVVAKGDTLYSISKKYGLTVTELKKINRLDSNTISVGQSLLLK
ncbi:MAG TPA: glucosaminidase domain-containing protein [Flavobacteriaceae bacterium]|nr:glucosaminidase domain-containing protein [Flavobacteriaceae bacterium]